MRCERSFVVDADQSEFRLIFNGLAHIELASRACPDAACSGASAFRMGRSPGSLADQGFGSPLNKRMGTRASVAGRLTMRSGKLLSRSRASCFPSKQSYLSQVPATPAMT